MVARDIYARRLMANKWATEMEWGLRILFGIVCVELVGLAWIILNLGCNTEGFSCPARVLGFIH